MDVPPAPPDASAPPAALEAMAVKAAAGTPGSRGLTGRLPESRRGESAFEPQIVGCEATGGPLTRPRPSSSLDRVVG